MATGTVKWFNPEKGFGFILPDDGGSDVFVHRTAVQSAGLQTLADGTKVKYDLEEKQDREGRSKVSAVNLQVQG
jgi:CspA family cold shock protein